MSLDDAIGGLIGLENDDYGGNELMGWLWRKDDRKIMGKTSWTKYWAVLALEAHSILFFKKQPQVVRIGTEEGVVDIQSLKHVAVLDEKKEGRFELCTHDNRVHQFHARTGAEAQQWVQALLPYRATDSDGPATANTTATTSTDDEWSNVPSRDRSQTDSVDKKLTQSRGRKMTTLLKRMVSINEDGPSIDTDATDASKLRAGTFEMDIRGQPATVEYHKDLSERTSHCTWRFFIPGSTRRHVVELLHGRTFGKRVVVVDGNRIHESRKVLDSGSDHPLLIEGVEFVLRILNKGFTGFSYRFYTVAQLAREMEAKGGVDTDTGRMTEAPELMAGNSTDSAVAQFDTLDGWLWHKTEQRILGRATWTKYWCVYEKMLCSIRFFETQQDYFCNDEKGVINLQALRNVYTHETNPDRFDIITFDGHRHQLRSEEGQASVWIQVALAHKSKTDSLAQDAAAWEDIRVRDRANTDSVDDMQQRRNRKVSQIMSSSISETSMDVAGGDGSSVLPPSLKKLAMIKRGTFKLMTHDGSEFDIQYFKDTSERTSHCTWRFAVDGKMYTIEVFHGRTWGRRRLVSNGQTIHDSRKTLDDGSNHLLEIGAKKYKFVVQILNTGFEGFRYRLETYESLKERIATKNLASKMQPDKVSEMEGYLSQKNDILLGFGVYKKYYAVLERTLDSVLLFESQDAYLSGIELGIIHVKNLLNVRLTTDTAEGVFTVMTADGHTLHFKAPTLEEAHHWVACLLSYKVSFTLDGGGDDEHKAENEVANANRAVAAGGVVPSRSRAYSDSVDSLVIKTRGRKLTEIFASALGGGGGGGGVDENNPLAKALRPLADSEHVRVGKTKLPVNNRRRPVEVDYYIDQSEPTTHATWRFRLNDEKNKNKDGGGGGGDDDEKKNSTSARQQQQEQYIIEVFHGRKWGRRRVLVNGQCVHESRKTIDDGSNHLIEIKGAKFIARILNDGQAFKYRLETFESIKGKKDKNNMAFEVEPDTVLDVEGDLWTKSDQVLGFGIWKKHWAVLDRTFRVICLYPSEEAYLKGAENDVVKLTGVTFINFPRDKLIDGCFDFVARGVKYELKAGNYTDARQWVAAILPFQVAGDGADTEADSTNNNTDQALAAAEAAVSKTPKAASSRRLTDQMDAVVFKTRERGSGSLFTKEKNPLADALNPVTSNNVDVGDMQIVLQNQPITVAYFKDYTQRTTHVSWSFQFRDQPYKIEIFHGRYFGRRQILVNGMQVHESRHLLDSGSKHSVMVYDQRFILTILPDSNSTTGFAYDIYTPEAFEAKLEAARARRGIIVVNNDDHMLNRQETSNGGGF